MSLEDILKTTKAVLATAKEDLLDRPDEWIRKQYETIGDKIPDAQFQTLPFVMSFLGASFGISSAYFITPESSASYTPVSFMSFYIPLLILVIPDITYGFWLFLGELPNPKKNTETPNLLATLCNNYNKAVRPFVLAASAYFLKQSAGEITGNLGFDIPYFTETSFTTTDGMPSSVIHLLGGLGFFSLASSMYLKDRTPRQFKKDPFWKRAYDAVTETVKGYIPTPASVPIPAQYCNTKIS